MGVGQVIEREKRKNCVILVFTLVAKTLAKNFGSEIYFCVVHGNTIPEEHMKRLGLEINGEHRWIHVVNENATENSKSHL